MRFLAVLLVLLSTLGCQDMARGVAKMHGVTVDPFPGTCAPSSLQAGYCVKAGVQEAKP